MEVTWQEFKDAIKYLRNWAASGPDRIHNFFPKYITSGHPRLRIHIENIINNKEPLDFQLVKARTILLPKNDSHTKTEYRPIVI